MGNMVTLNCLSFSWKMINFGQQQSPKCCSVGWYEMSPTSTRCGITKPILKEKNIADILFPLTYGNMSGAKSSLNVFFILNNGIYQITFCFLSFDFLLFSINLTLSFIASIKVSDLQLQVAVTLYCLMARVIHHMYSFIMYVFSDSTLGQTHYLHWITNNFFQILIQPVNFFFFFLFFLDLEVIQ